MRDNSRTHAEVLLEQHREIEKLIGQIEGFFSGRVKEPLGLADRIQRLCHLLPDHFRLEEDGGLFDEAVLVAPRLVARARVLQSQHRSLTELFQSLCKQVSPEKFQIQGWWADAQAAFLRFKEEIIRHEHEENLLLQEAFLADLGAKD